MLIIGDSRRGAGRVVLLSVLLSVGASVIATVLVHDALDHPDAPARTAPATPRVVLVDGAEEGPVAPPPGEALAELEREVARLRRAVGAEGEARGPEGVPDIAPLLAIEQGERQMAILDEVKRLVDRGDAVVPEIVGALKAGHDRDWGGGFSFGGNMFRGYPRLRTALIDILRQIGTTAAKRGLLEALAADASATDYRDLLLVYGTTGDATMLAGIEEMIPDILAELRDAEEDELFLEQALTRWMREHEVAAPPELLADTILANLRRGGSDRGSFALLVERDPEKACGVLAQLAREGGDASAVRQGLGSMPFRDVPLARVAEFLELTLGRMDLDESARIHLYLQAPTQPCRTIEAPEERAADARTLLAVLRQRLAVETGEGAKRMLQGVIERLEKAIG